MTPDQIAEETAASAPPTDERPWPYSQEAERAVLGAMLISAEAIDRVADRLQPVDFFREGHQLIYQAVRDLSARGTPVDPLTIGEWLQARDKVDAVGGPAYLFSLTDGVPRGSNAEAYAAIVRDKAIRRRLLMAATKITTDALNQATETATVLDRAEQWVLDVDRGGAGPEFMPASAIVREGWPILERILEERRGVTGVATGFTDLDAMTRGLQPGNLVLIASRPSMGKTSLALNVAYTVAARNETVGVFSLEMSRQELLVRLVASIGEIDGQRLLSGYLPPTQYSALGVAMSRVSDSSLWVDDTATIGALALRSKSRRLKAAAGLSLIIIDYLQLLVPDRRNDNRSMELAEITRSLKQLAKELDVPVLALSQLSRAPEARADKRPQLADLRESGALEQDADVVMLLYRPEQYQELATPENRGLAELILAKQRNGPTGTVRLTWRKQYTRFDNYSRRLLEDDDGSQTARDDRDGPAGSPAP